MLENPYRFDNATRGWVTRGGKRLQQIAVLEGAEEFEFGDGPVAALLVHGFTGTPQGMRPLGRYLVERGLAVVGIRLPGHGTTWQDLNTRTAEEWITAAEEAFHQLAARKEKVFLVGLSFGAAICLDIAARYPDQVAGFVGLAPFLFTRNPRRFLAPLIRRIAKSVPGVGNDIFDPEQRELVYDRFPVVAGHLMLRFGKKVVAELGAVRSPTLLIHSRNDHTAHPSNSQVIHDTISSEDKEIVWLDRSYHVITLDVDRDHVYERTHSFIEKRSRDAF
ncbi:MAG: alpha/beta fold hydrolase [Actinobacteria bacterium]|nr:alpha/beta fold hydrolase [Actinomycetota bacterium]